MSEMNRIDCGICEDLMPLVEDGVACEQSRVAVRKHLEGCEACRKKYVEGAAGRQTDWAQDDGKDDKRIIGRVREKVSGWLLAVIMTGLLLGVLLTAANGAEPWLMLLIFPAICGGVYWLGGRLWRWVPVAAMAIWVIVLLLMSGGRLGDIPMAFVLGVIPLGLSYLGALAAAMLKYAFKGEF